MTEAQYLLRRAGSWLPIFQSVPYDIEATLRRFHSTGDLEAAGPIARLFYREVTTASHHLTSFLSSYARWSEGGRLDLEASVVRFMNAGMS